MQNSPPPTNGKLADRLAWARGRKQITQQELARLSKIAQSTIASWEKGARGTGRNITALAEPLGVDELWLATGKGSPERGVRLAPVNAPEASFGLPDQLRAQVTLGNITEREAALLHKFRMATDEAKTYIETAADHVEKDPLFVVYDKAKLK